MDVNEFYCSKDQLILMLDSSNSKAVSDALLYLTFNVDDFHWVQSSILKKIDDLDEDVAGLAITCLGHVARIYGKIDKGLVVPILKLKAADSRFCGRVQDALDDIEMFAMN